MLIEGFGPDGRYFRSWTADQIDADDWTPLTGSSANPFAAYSNVAFVGGDDWTHDISHGEFVRHNVDQTLEIDYCFLWNALGVASHSVTPPGVGPTDRCI